MRRHVLVKHFVNNLRHGITLQPTFVMCHEVHNVTEECLRWVIHDVNMVFVDQLLLKVNSLSEGTKTIVLN